MVQAVGVRLQRGHALLLKAPPQVAHGTLSSSVEEQAHRQSHATEHSCRWWPPRPVNAAGF
jgi:hypothetical protein